MPSALERNGDFSQTSNNAGALRFIRNPFSALPCNVNTGGAGCFPGNVIPQNRDPSDGPANPESVPACRTRRWWAIQSRRGTTTTSSRATRTSCAATTSSASTGTSGRNTTFYTRFQMGKEVFGRGQYNETAPALIAGAGMGFPWSDGSYDINTVGLRGTLTHIVHGIDRARGHRRDQLGGAGRVSAGAVRLGCARLSQSPARPPAVLRRRTTRTTSCRT